jgi:cyclohexanecarboxylate-CoA ligase
MASTPFLSDMVNLPEEPRARVSRTLRTWPCAGAPIPRVLVQRAKAEMNLDVLSCWGMTENAGSPSRARATRRRRCSRPTVARCRAARCAWWMREAPAARRHRRQPAGARDHAFRRLPQEAHQPRWTRGWFDTGDLARMDRDGYIRIVGRTKDVIIRGGENMPVAEVENLIIGIPRWPNALSWPCRMRGWASAAARS